jgi:uncharacterized protein HemX
MDSKMMWAGKAAAVVALVGGIGAQSALLVKQTAAVTTLQQTAQEQLTVARQALSEAQAARQAANAPHAPDTALLAALERLTSTQQQQLAIQQAQYNLVIASRNAATAAWQKRQNDITADMATNPWHGR